MLTIERNNPHKKISLGVLSVALGFASTYALLSAIMPINDFVTGSNPQGDKPVASVQGVTTNNEESKQEQKTDPSAATGTEGASGGSVGEAPAGTSYPIAANPAPAPSPAPVPQTAPTSVAPAAPQPVQPPATHTPGLIDHVIEISETVVETAVPIL